MEEPKLPKGFKPIPEVPWDKTPPNAKKRPSKKPEARK